MDISFLTSNRFKSFYWRSGMMFLATFIGMVGESLTGTGLSPQVVVVLGLILGEVSKFLNTVKDR